MSASVEAAPYSSARMLRARVTVDLTTPGGYRMIEADVIDVSWGPVTPRVRFRTGEFAPASCPAGAEIVVSLRDHRGPGGRMDESQFQMYDDAWSDAVWLVLPDGRIAPEAPALRMTGEPIGTRDELLAALRAEAERARTHGRVDVETLSSRISLPEPIRLRINPHLWQVGLSVPRDARLVGQALAWARDADPAYRAAGVYVLGRLPRTDDAERAVRAALADPASGYAAGRWALDLADRGSRRYPVREAAVRSLRAWEAHGARRHAWLGTPREESLHAEPYPRFRPIRIGRLVACAIGAVAVAACAGRRGRGVVRRVIHLSLAVAALAALAMSWRSAAVVDWAVWADGGAQWEVVSADGRLVVFRVERPPADAVVRLAPPTPVAAQYDAFGTSDDTVGAPTMALPLKELGRVSAGEFAFEHGMTEMELAARDGKLRPFTVGYRLARVPWSWLAAGAALPSAVAMLLHLRRRMRLRARARGGRCAHCGYDLRMNGGAARCPECGGRGAVRVRAGRRAAPTTIGALVALAVAAAVPWPAGAYVVITPSVPSAEAVPHVSPWVARVRVTAHLGRDRHRTIEADVIDPLWGPVVPRVRFRPREGLSYLRTLEGAELIVSLRDGRYDGSGRPVADQFHLGPRPDHWADGAWAVLPDGRIAPETPIVRMTGDPVRTRDELLTILRAEARHAGPGGPRGLVRLSASYGGTTLPSAVLPSLGRHDERPALLVPKDGR
ncbi:MAG TPA: hypothetical protein VEA69_20125, partial [Tepidisphaeraceae bacterium]|nr:hypothetical protein [Tepidisphaeraceae bacterium]